MAQTRRPRKKRATRNSKSNATVVGAPKIAANSIKKTQKPTIAKDRQHAIRRILAERVVIGKNKDVYNLIDWHPSWQLQSKSKRGGNPPPESDVMNDWNNHKQKNLTFDFNGDTVLKCLNGTEDDSKEQVRSLLESVVDKFQELYIKAPTSDVADRLFLDEDWEFGEGEEEKARDIAGGGDEARLSAGAVMRASYIEIRRSRRAGKDKDKDITQYAYKYKAVGVKFVGKVDEDDPNQLSRPTAPPHFFIAAILSSRFHHKSPKQWTDDEMYAEISKIQPIVQTWTDSAPYLLKQPWPLFFARLFFDADELVTSMEKSGLGIHTTKGWDNRTRDFFLNTYKAEYAKWEHRPVDAIMRTYLECRDLIRDQLRGPPGSEKRVRAIVKENAKRAAAALASARQEQEEARRLAKEAEEVEEGPGSEEEVVVDEEDDEEDDEDDEEEPDVVEEED
jgi:hypothetical protein